MTACIRFHYVLAFSAVLAIGGLTGCGGPEGNEDHLPTFDVTAKVTVDGKPLENGMLIMTPTDPKIPNSGAQLGAGGTAKFSTYDPEGGIPAGEYTANVMMDSSMKPVPGVKPVTITVTEEMEGGELPIQFEGTGRTQSSPLPPP